MKRRNTSLTDDVTSGTASEISIECGNFTPKVCHLPSTTTSTVALGSPLE